MSFVDKDWIREIKESFIDYVNEHGDISIATQKTLSSYREMLDDYDDAVAFWVGIALAQWNYGMLQSRYRNEYLYEITN